jgi:hypothetical protein
MWAERVFADNKKSLQFHQDSRQNHANQGAAHGMHSKTMMHPMPL